MHLDKFFWTIKRFKGFEVRTSMGDGILEQYHPSSGVAAVRLRKDMPCFMFDVTDVYDWTYGKHAQKDCDAIHVETGFGCMYF